MTEIKNAEDFCAWLRGFLDMATLSGSVQLNEKQVAVLRRHLSDAFRYGIDLKAGSQEHQELLQKIHDGEIDTVIHDYSDYGTYDKTLFRC